MLFLYLYELLVNSEAGFTDAQILQFILSILGVALIVYGGLYILKAIAVCKMAKKRGFKNWWLGMIPYANYYMLGKLAGPVRIFGIDVKNVGLFLLIFSAFIDAYNLMAALTFIPVISVSVITIILNTISYFSYIIELAYYICYFALVFALFGKYTPEKRFLFTVLSFIQVLFPIFLICIMNKKPYNSFDDYYKEQMAKRFGQTYNPYENPFDTKENPFSANSQSNNNTVEDPFDEFK